MFPKALPKGLYRFLYVHLITFQPVTLMSVYYSTLLCDVILILRDHKEASDGITSLELDLDPPFSTNVLETFALTFMGLHHMHVAMVVVAIVGISGIIVVGVILGLSGAAFVIPFDFVSVKCPTGILASL